jgi:endoglucanase
LFSNHIVSEYLKLIDMRISFFTIFIFCLCSILAAQEPADKIRLNQIGFYPDAPKVAVVTADEGNTFNILNKATGEKVYSGNLSAPRKSAFSKKMTRIADFSAFKNSGAYMVEIPGVGKSYSFEVKPFVHMDLTKGLIKGFYYQRMSTPLLPEHAGKWSHPAGHPDDKVLIHPSAISPGRLEFSVIACPGGWYDAGDYNKYIVNSGITMGTLLSLYEDFPGYFDKLELNIPESGNSIPDLLDEILWNLRWMFTMQDPYDGGVYNKVTNESFDEMIMPHEATKPRYVVQKGTAATLDLAAVMAQAGRIFRKFDNIHPGLADSCVAAAVNAWKWAVENPDVAYNQNAMNKMFKPAITTGGYGDNNYSDEFIWAAAELYITLKDDSYYKHTNMLPDTLMPLPSWGDVRLLGYYTLARHSKKLTSAARGDFKTIKKRLIVTADRMFRGMDERAYMTVMGRNARDFVWGSNSVAANQGILLIQAYKLSKERKYLNYAISNLDYILGRNATGYSYVTGFGKKTPMFIHHRQSEADGIPEPVPGLLAGGPNPRRQDGCKYPSLTADEAYVDSVCSYASNEIAINWNAPAAYLAGAIEALINKY